MFFTEDFVQKAKFSSKNLTDWHDKTLECCCHTITCSHLKLSQSLAISTSLYLPWDPYKLCWKKKNVFFLKIFHFSICLTSNKLYWIEDQLANISTCFISQRVGVGKLNCRRVDWILQFCSRVPSKILSESSSFKTSVLVNT